MQKNVGRGELCWAAFSIESRFALLVYVFKDLLRPPGIEFFDLGAASPQTRTTQFLEKHPATTLGDNLRRPPSDLPGAKVAHRRPNRKQDRNSLFKIGSARYSSNLMSLEMCVHIGDRQSLTIRHSGRYATSAIVRDILKHFSRQWVPRAEWLPSFGHLRTPEREPFFPFRSQSKPIQPQRVLSLDTLERHSKFARWNLF